MIDHVPAATQMVTATTSLCASCGAEVRMDWCGPAFGLCEPCEDRIQQGPVSWPAAKEDQCT